MNPTKKILFIDQPHPLCAEMLQAAGWFCDQQPDISREAVLACIGDYAGIIIKSRIKLDPAIIDRAHQLQFIARVGSGKESIAVEYAEANGIKIITSPEGNRDALGEHAMGMLLALLNHLPKVDQEVRNGIWIREANRGTELMGKTIGIIGYGYMGNAFAQRLSGFGVKVLAHDKYKKDYGNQFAQAVDLETIFFETDILSLHVPLTEETQYMVNQPFIDQFAKNIYLINTARGPVVETAALVQALKEGKVIGAALDVLEYESISFEAMKPEQFPPAYHELMASKKVILSPHIAGWTHASKVKHARVLAEKIIAL